jgi:cytochrome P450
VTTASPSIGTEAADAADARGLADFTFPSPELTQCPFGFYRALQEEAPVYRVPGRDEFFVTRRRDILHVLANPELFSNEIYHSDPRVLPGAAEWLAAGACEGAGAIRTPFTMGMSDPPEHTVKRRAAAGLVSRERLAAMEPVVERLAHGLIDGFAGRGDVEFRSEFADALAMLTICELAGFPSDDRALFLSWNRVSTRLGRHYLTDEELTEQDRDLPEQEAYCRRLIIDRVEHPRDDFLSEFVREQVERDGELDLAYLTNEVNMILNAGNETTARLLTNTVLLLLRNPEELDKLRADRALVRGALEESLRFEAPTQWVWRYVTHDTEIDGVPIPAESLVMLVYGAANRDETWDDPDRFRIDRPDVHKYHMAFGGGVHLCIGAPVARLEARIALEILLDRLPNLRLVPGKNDFANIDNFQKRVATALYVHVDPIRL